MDKYGDKEIVDELIQLKVSQGHYKNHPELPHREAIPPCTHTTI